MPLRIVTASLGDDGTRKAVMDTATAAGAGITAAGWMEALSLGYHGIMAVGAGILVAGRLWLMSREILERRRRDATSRRGALPLDLPDEHAMQMQAGGDTPSRGRRVLMVCALLVALGVLVMAVSMGGIL